MPLGVNVQHSDRHHLPLGVAYALATSVVASSAAAVVKFLADTLSPWFIVWVQYGVCVILTLPWAMRLGPGGLRSGRYLLHFIRGMGGWLGFTAYYLALPHIPLVDAGLLRSAAPLWVPAVVFLVFRERLPWLRWIALVTGFLGVLLVLQPSAGGVSGGHLLGVTSGLALAVSMACTRALSASEPAARVLLFYFGLAFLASTPAGVMHIGPVTAEQWLGLVYVGIAIFLTMVLYTRAYTHAPTSVVAPLGYLAVPLAAALDWLVWKHVPGPAVLAGSLVVIGSGVLAVTLGARQRAEH